MRIAPIAKITVRGIPSGYSLNEAPMINSIETITYNQNAQLNVERFIPRNINGLLILSNS